MCLTGAGSYYSLLHPLNLPWPPPQRRRRMEHLSVPSEVPLYGGWQTQASLRCRAYKWLFSQPLITPLPLKPLDNIWREDMVWSRISNRAGALHVAVVCWFGLTAVCIAVVSRWCGLWGPEWVTEARDIVWMGRGGVAGVLADLSPVMHHLPLLSHVICIPFTPLTPF